MDLIDEVADLIDDVGDLTVDVGDAILELDDLNAGVRDLIAAVADAMRDVRHRIVDIRDISVAFGHPVDEVTDTIAGVSHPSPYCHGAPRDASPPNKTGRPEAARSESAMRAAQAGSAAVGALRRLAKRPPSSRRRSSRPCAPPDSLMCA